MSKLVKAYKKLNLEWWGAIFWIGGLAGGLVFGVVLGNPLAGVCCFVTALAGQTTGLAIAQVKTTKRRYNHLSMLYDHQNALYHQLLDQHDPPHVVGVGGMGALVAQQAAAQAQLHQLLNLGDAVVPYAGVLPAMDDEMER